jgi:lipopolysaccharide export LptBFGC system permease protein LptF
MQKIKAMLANERGEAYVGEAVKIVIAIVLGAALLAGLVLVFNSIVLPKTEQWIEDLFANADDYVTDIENSGYTPA